jgi:phosphoglycerol transferase MdoB-like AlkP superfamily enzyme
LSTADENDTVATRDGARRALFGGVASIAVIYAIVSLIARIVIAVRADAVEFDGDWQSLVLAFIVGSVRDLAVATLLIAPIYWTIASYNRVWRVALMRGVIHGWVVVFICLFVFGAVADLFFWEEFASRLNGIAVNYLIFPHEVIGNIRESFDVNLYLPIVITVGLVIWWWKVRRPVAAAMSPKLRRPGFGRATLGTLAMVAVSLTVLNLLPASVSENREIDEIAENGLVTMARAAWTNEQDYDGVYATIDRAKGIRMTRALVAQDNTRFLDPDGTPSIRRFVDNGDNAKKLNIVLVTEESLGADYVTGLDSANPVPVTPNLARLADESIFFTNMYSSGDRTVRGLEATETAFQPIPGISTARRPESEGMYSFPWLLKQFGYGSGVLYGGFNGFDNMGVFWRGIGFDHVWDQRDIRHDAFSTIWGVSDEDLFTEALRRMDENAKSGQPFLLTLMTVSNHRPFLFPEHFKADPAFTNRRERGAAYADWAFADFIKRARAHPWFDDTVFILVADHGQKINGAAKVPLEKFRIPALIYSPKHIAPRRIDTLSAQIDLMPTLLGVLGFSYESPFFGVDVTRLPPDGGRIAVAHNFSIAFAQGEHAVVLDPNGQIMGYRFKKGYFPLELSEVDPATRDLAVAVTQTAHQMFYNRRYHQEDAAAPGS